MGNPAVFVGVVLAQHGPLTTAVLLYKDRFPSASKWVTVKIFFFLTIHSLFIPYFAL